jgi:nitrous oxide reductase accessory protein NosL
MCAALAAWLLLALAPPQAVTAQINRLRCHSCGRFLDTSPARIKATVNYREHDKVFEVCSVFCLCELLEDCPDYELKIVRIKDYTQSQEKEPRMLSATTAVYLYDATGNEEKTSTPYVYAFADEATAKKYCDEVGGSVLKWEDVLVKCIAAAAEYEPSRPQSIHPEQR